MKWLVSFLFLVFYSSVYSAGYTTMYTRQNLDKQKKDEYSLYQLKRLYHLYDFYMIAGEENMAYLKAKAICDCVSSMSDSIIRNNCEEVGLLLRDIPQILIAAGDKKEAKDISEIVVECLKSAYGKNNLYVIEALLDLSSYSANLGLWNDAIGAASAVVDATEEEKEKYHEQLSFAYYKLSRYYLSVASIMSRTKKVDDDYYKSYKYAINSYLIRKEFNGEQHSSTLRSLFQVGLSLAMTSNDMSEGLSIMKRALAELERMDEDDYIDILSNYADALRDNGDYEEAIVQELRQYQYNYERYGEQNEYTLHNMRHLAEYYSYVNDSTNAVDYSIKVTNHYISHIERFFPKLNKREREIALNTEGIHMWFDETLPQIAHKYNSSLLNFVMLKSILLRKAITNYTYNERTDEDRFLLFCDIIRSASYNLNKKISEKDVIIEFISFPCSRNKSNKQYSILYLKKGDKYPNYLPLFTTRDVNSWRDNVDLIGFLYDLIWNPIEKAVPGMCNIYFSPTGFLNTLPLEYLFNNHDELISDIYNIYRVSSALELLSVRDTFPKNNNAIIFGGLNYDSEVRELSSYKHNGIMEEKPSLSRGMSDSLIVRGGFEYLENTNEEAETISDILKKKGYSSKLYNGNDGTEETMKTLSGKEIEIIHLSTHGMYIPESDINFKKGYNDFHFIVDESFVESDSLRSHEIAREDNILTRSFLVMSGGNMLAHQVERPMWMDDGILTAQEISELDLSRVDLVVLSACQTGLGDLSNEGVLGLQRGFKKAGANTILMSLDKVDDEATKILMVEFYKNLMAGKSKQQSLKDAQHYLRQVENGKYDDPDYWASFILLDGLN